MPSPGDPGGLLNRAILFDYLSQACDEIDQKLANKRDAYKREQQDTIDLLARKLEEQRCEIESLLSENHKLKSRLLQGARGKDSEPETRSKLSLGPINKPFQDDQQHNGTREPLGDLSANISSRTPASALKQPRGAADSSKHGDTPSNLVTIPRDKYETLKISGKQMALKCQKYKESALRWQTYAEQLEQKLDRKSHRRAGSRTTLIGSASPAAAEAPNDHTALAAARSEPDPGNLRRPSPDSSFASDSGLPTSGTVREGPGLSISRDASTSNPLPTTPHLPRSPELGPLVGRDDNLVEPTLPRVDGRAGVVESTTKVKDEPSSDGPVFLSAQPVRKRKSTGQEVDETPAPRRLKTEDSGSDPVMTGVADNSPHESLDLDGTRPELPTPKKKRSEFEPEEASPTMARRDAPDQLAPPDTCVAHTRTPDKLRKQYGNFLRKDVGRFQYLQPTNSARTPTRTHPQKSRNQQQGSDIRTSIAQDADEEQDPFPPGDLAELLEHHCEAPAPQISRKEPARWDLEPGPRLPPRRVFPFDKQPNTPVMAVPNMRPQARTCSPTRGSKPIDSVSDTSIPKSAKASTRPAKPALRSLPLSKLNLDDFKPNPKVNDGFNFAFDDVVRGRERESLAGCTDPSCDGGKDWKVIARSELRHAGPSHVNQPANVKIMEDYLGDEAFRLGRMDRLQKEELWVEARAWQQANKYGRCRHRFARPQSPKQFWETDFPSTQEQERDKADGQKRERTMIEQRYREAMRKGGRWLFRDE